MKRAIFLCILSSTLLLASTALTYGGVNVPVPPQFPIDSYAGQFHVIFGNAIQGITLNNAIHKEFTDRQYSQIGQDEYEDFLSQVEAQATIVFGGLEIMTLPLNLSGPVQTVMRDKVGQLVGTWDTEMLSMNLSGFITELDMPVMIRESPTLQSLGQTSVTDMGTFYRVDSFFDIFVELSTDGGQTWMPGDSSAHMELVPEPGTLAMIACGGLVLMAGRYSRRVRRLSAR